MMKLFFSGALVFYITTTTAQYPGANFSLPSNGCLSQNIFIQNQSTNATRYEWDLCQGDLALTPTATTVKNLGGSITLGIDIVFDGSSWYGFVVSRNTNSILRLDFGQDLGSAPSVEDLGNISNVISTPSDIKIVYDQGNWYGFVYGYSNPALVRIDFGSSLSSTVDGSPPITASVIVSDAGVSNGGFDMIYDGNNWIISFIQTSTLTLVKLTSITTLPVPSDFISGIPTGAGYGDIVLQKSNGNFFGYMVNQSGGLLRLQFGTMMFSTPVIDNLSSFLPGSSRTYGLDAVLDNGIYYLLIPTLEGDLYKIILGADLTQIPTGSVNLGYLSILTNTLKTRYIKQGSRCFLFSTDFNSSNLFRVAFPGPSTCPANLITSSLSSLKIEFSIPGTSFISLKSYQGGNVDEISKAIVVSPQTAPDISFSSNGNCVNNLSNFIPSNSSNNINTYSWDFGDGGISTTSNPSHAYSVASTYYPTLTVTAANGCQNSSQDTLQIFNAPQSNFTLPPASPFCTNQTYPYTNTSTYDNGSNPTWQWSVNGTNVATTQDLNYLFTSSSAQSITLTASIPGCSSQSTQDVSTLVDGPLVTFDSPTTGCKGSSISFTNTTFGTITSQTWSFGDGDGSTQSNVSHTYSTTGVFPVSLSTTNSAGCQNSLSKNLSIYSVPQTDFAIEAPPLSCERSPSQFDNLTPALTDSNISSWTWNFGDAVSGTSTLKNPSYTYMSAGNYSVSLQATSNFGCSKSVQKSITIYSSPTAGFTNSVACVNQSTRFNDASTGAVSFYQWTVQNNILAGATPVYTFKSSGVFPITLTVTSSNGCTNQVSKNVTVPVLPVIDFIVQRPCTGNPSAFQELNAGGADPAVAWNWNFGQGSSTGSPASYQFPLEGGYTVTMSTTRQSGCVYSASKNISISKGPVAKFTPSVFAGAAPLYVSFTNSSTADSYMWNFGDAAQTTSAVTSPSFTYLSLGKYKALLTAKNNLGCSDTLSTEIDVVVPHIDIAMNGFSLTIDPASNTSKPIVTILNSGNIPLIDPTVVIDLGGGASIKEKISGMVRPGKSFVQTLGLQIIPSSLQYICAEIDVADDVNSENNKQCVSLSAEDVILNPYPNPSSSGQITLEWVGSAQESAQITVFGSNGEIVFEQHLDSVQTGLGQFSLRTSSLPNGLYLIRFAGSKTTKIFKVVIAN